jgi:hypothetical protein
MLVFISFKILIRRKRILVTEYLFIKGDEQTCLLFRALLRKGKAINFHKFSHNNKKINKCAVLFHKEQGVTHNFFTNAIKATNIYCVLDR